MTAASLDELLSLARKVREVGLQGSQVSLWELELEIFSGRFKEARRILGEIERDEFLQEGHETMLFEPAAALKEKLPVENAPGSESKAAAVDRLFETEGREPLEIQRELSELVHGLRAIHIPRPLARLQIALSKKHSWAIRKRFEERKGRDIRVRQKYNDCWVRALYDLPIAFLDPIRRELDYDRFLEAVQAIVPQSEIREAGLTFEDFPRVVEALGLRSDLWLPSEAELAEILGRTGAAVAGVAWFDEDVSEMGKWDVRLRMHQHAFLITGSDGVPGERRFTVRDSLLAHETWYSMPELNLLQIVVYEVLAGNAGARDAWIKST